MKLSEVLIKSVSIHFDELASPVKPLCTGIESKTLDFRPWTRSM